MNFSAASLLNELMAKQEKVDQPDIFLSHAYDDREIVLGVALKIEDLGYSVYIDWRERSDIGSKGGHTRDRCETEKKNASEQMSVLLRDAERISVNLDEMGTRLYGWLQPQNGHPSDLFGNDGKVQWPGVSWTLSLRVGRSRSNYRKAPALDPP